MGLPSPQEDPDIYDDQDCRPGCSYPAAGLAKLMEYQKNQSQKPAPEPAKPE